MNGTVSTSSLRIRPHMFDEAPEVPEREALRAISKAPASARRMWNGR